MSQEEEPFSCKQFIICCRSDGHWQCIDLAASVSTWCLFLIRSRKIACCWSKTWGESDLNCTFSNKTSKLSGKLVDGRCNLRRIKIPRLPGGQGEQTMTSQHYLVDGELNEVENDNELPVLKRGKNSAISGVVQRKKSQFRWKSMCKWVWYMGLCESKRSQTIKTLRPLLNTLCSMLLRKLHRTKRGT